MPCTGTALGCGLGNDVQIEMIMIRCRKTEQLIESMMDLPELITEFVEAPGHLFSIRFGWMSTFTAEIQPYKWVTEAQKKILNSLRRYGIVYGLWRVSSAG